MAKTYQIKIKVETVTKLEESSEQVNKLGVDLCTTCPLCGQANPFPKWTVCDEIPVTASLADLETFFLRLYEVVKRLRQTQMAAKHKKTSHVSTLPS